MNLQTRLAIKNFKLMEREALLRDALADRVHATPRSAHLLFFIIAPFCIGFLGQRLSSTHYGARVIRIMSPLGSLFLKV